MNELEKRLIDLEIKFTHQEEFLNELNLIVVKQQATIEKMAKEILSLRDIQEQGHVDANRTLKDEVPPHY